VEGGHIGLHVGIAGLLQELTKALEAEDPSSHVMNGGQLIGRVGGRTLLHHRHLNAKVIE